MAAVLCNNAVYAIGGDLKHWLRHEMGNASLDPVWETDSETDRGLINNSNNSIVVVVVKEHYKKMANGRD